MHAGDHRLHHLVPARSRHATTLRHALIRWAQDVELPGDTTDAIALAAYEAMINVATPTRPKPTACWSCPRSCAGTPWTSRSAIKDGGSLRRLIPGRCTGGACR